jgi:hypothetical protein
MNPTASRRSLICSTELDRGITRSTEAVSLYTAIILLFNLVQIQAFFLPSLPSLFLSSFLRFFLLNFSCLLILSFLLTFFPYLFLRSFILSFSYTLRISWFLFLFLSFFPLFLTGWLSSVKTHEERGIQKHWTRSTYWSTPTEVG